MLFQDPFYFYSYIINKRIINMPPKLHHHHHHHHQKHQEPKIRSLDILLSEEHKNLKLFKKKFKEYEQKMQKTKKLIDKLQQKKDKLYVPSYPKYEGLGAGLIKSPDPVGGIKRVETQLPNGGETLITTVTKEGKKIREAYKNLKGELHRLDGPAVIEYSPFDGKVLNSEYWKNGIFKIFRP